MSGIFLIFLLFSAHGAPKKTDTDFLVGGWVPYWKSQAASDCVKEQADKLDEISPFSYEVTGQGNLIDTFGRKPHLWQDLYAFCRAKNIAVVPTIFWTSTTAMHRCLSDPKCRTQHVTSVIKHVLKDDVDGININYERVAPADRDGFLALVKELSNKLHEHGRVFYVTVGARTSDRTIAYHHDLPKKLQELPKKTCLHPKKMAPVSLSPGSGLEAQNYKKTLVQYADRVYIMGYDEWGRPYKQTSQNKRHQYYISHASHQWLEQAIRYALTYIPKEKIVLGIPTYALEFNVYKNGDALRFKKSRNLNYPTVAQLIKDHKKRPILTAGKERCFTYNERQQEKYVCYLDAACIKDKIALAQKYGLRGIYFFKVDGYEDPAMWQCL